MSSKREASFSSSSSSAAAATTPPPPPPPPPPQRLMNTCLRSIYTARRVILQLLEDMGYDVSDYIDFSINEVDAMIKHSQCDMLLSQRAGAGAAKAYVIFYGVNAPNKLFRKQVVDKYVEDLFQIEQVLVAERDTLVIVIDTEPNDPLKEYLRALFERDRIFVIVHNIKRLQFNICRDIDCIPKHTILSARETDEFKQQYHVTELTKKLPEIGRFDPVGLAIGIRPGQVCRIDRKSPTALVHTYYRVCVQ